MREIHTPGVRFTLRAYRFAAMAGRGELLGAARSGLLVRLKVERRQRPTRLRLFLRRCLKYFCLPEIVASISVHHRSEFER
jgi:hypothetical protein